MFSRLGTWCHDHRRLVLGLWVAVVALGFAVSGAVGSAFRDEFNLPDVESREGFDILEAADIADAIAYIVTRPRHVSINEILIRPTDQRA